MVKIQTKVLVRSPKPNSMKLKKKKVAKTALSPNYISRGRYNSEIEEIERLTSSMSLNEMLDAFNIIGRVINGEKIPHVKSPKVNAYAEKTIKLYKRARTKQVLKKLQLGLAEQIIKKNKATTNAKKARRLYQAFMEEE